MADAATASPHLPLYSAAIGAGAAWLFAILKSWLDRRQSLEDKISMLVAALANVARHAADSVKVMNAGGGGANAAVLLKWARFPDTGLMSVEVKELSGLSPPLMRDLMTLVIYMRNTNILIDATDLTATSPAQRKAAFAAISRRLQHTAKWAELVRTGLGRRGFKGGAKYSEQRLVTVSKHSISPGP